MRVSTIAFLLLALLPAPRCHASAASGLFEVLDQSSEAVWNDYPDTSRMAANSIGWHAQVVTPGISGTLSRVELGVWRSRDTTVPLIVDIVEIGEEMFYDTGRIAGRAVDASTVPVSNAEIRPAFTVSVDFSDSNIRLIAGQPFAILLRADNELGYGWAGNINDLDTYPGGGVYGYRLRPELITYKPRDAHFRTFVLVPEPGALGIAATSQFIVFARGRYARRSAA